MTHRALAAAAVAVLAVALPVGAEEPPTEGLRHRVTLDVEGMT